MDFCLFTSEDLKKFFSKPPVEELTWMDKLAYSAEDLLKKALVVWYAGIVIYGTGIEASKIIESLF